MTHPRMILALPFTLLGLALLYLSALIGGERMADIMLTSMERNLPRAK